MAQILQEFQVSKSFWYKNFYKITAKFPFSFIKISFSIHRYFFRVSPAQKFYKFSRIYLLFTFIQRHNSLRIFANFSKISTIFSVIFFQNYSNFSLSFCLKNFKKFSAKCFKNLYNGFVYFFQGFMKFFHSFSKVSLKFQKNFFGISS